jgi:hypothetical protein
MRLGTHDMRRIGTHPLCPGVPEGLEALAAEQA